MYTYILQIYLLLFIETFILMKIGPNYLTLYETFREHRRCPGTPKLILIYHRPFGTVGGP